MSTSWDCSFSPCKIENQSQIQHTEIITNNFNMAYPYYMSEDFFLVAPPMAIKIEREAANEKSTTVKLVARLKNLLKNKNKTMARTIKRRSMNMSYKTRQYVHRSIEELSYKLQRFKIKTIKVKKGSET